MYYDMKRVDKDTVKVTTEEGNIITIHFKTEDNPDIEDIVTDNLLTSYDKRLKKSINNSNSNKMF